MSLRASSAAGIIAGLLCLAVLGRAGLAEAGSPDDARLCEDYAGLPAQPGGDAPAGMVFIRGGAFILGSDEFYPEERPARPATVADFWIDRTEVTNAEFAAFVAATGYRTIAERGLDPKTYPDLPPEAFVPGSMVFVEPKTSKVRSDPVQWWVYVPHADWRHPEGPESSIAGRANHPVVHVAYDDALAYARWKGRDLPTEEEWEFAARGGRTGAAYAWGEEPAPDGVAMANSWQGFFPYEDDATDGHHGTASVGCYPANGYGLFDVTGNVWEWASDRYVPGHGARSSDRSVPGKGQSPAGTIRVIKGGSWLCSPNFCGRFRPASRQPQEADLGASHVGFRTVLRPGP